MNKKMLSRMINNTHLSFSATALLFSALLVPGVSWAVEGVNAIEEVLVTARRKEERLQDVPVAVASFGAQQIKEQKIQTESDLQLVTPGLTVRQTGSSNQISFSLRGQSIDAFSQSPPSVANYLNDILVSGFGVSSFVDIESIQVLKGPQGTLFGRNSTGGAVLYQTTKPSNDFEGYVNVGLGNYGNQEVKAAVNIPLSDSFSARLVTSQHRRDGIQRNRLLDTDTHQIDYQLYRSTFLYSGDSFENETMLQYVKDDTIASGLKLHSATGTGLFSILYSPAVAAAEVARNESAGFYDVFNEQDNRHEMEQKFLSNKTTIEISENLTFKNIFGYNDVVSNDSIDIDGTSFPIISISLANFGVGAEGYTFGTEQWSNETQLLGETKDEKLSYIIGFYYSEDVKETNNPICFPCDLGPAIPPTIFRYHFDVEDVSTAVFAQGTYRLTDTLSFTAGYRHTWEEVAIDYFAGDINNTLIPAPFGAVNDSLKINEPSWTISLEYKPTDEWLIYLANRGSFRSSGFNGVGSEPNPNLAGGVVANDYEEETTYDFEVGLKFAGELAGIPSRFNLAIYDQVLDQAQRTVYPTTASVTGNVEEAQISGFEFDGIFDLTDWLQVGGAIAYTDAEFTKPSADVAGALFTFGPYADSPEWVRNIYFKAVKELEDGGSVYLRGDYYAQSSFYYSNLGDTLAPDTEIDGYDLFNIRVGWEKVMGSNFSIAGYVKNLADEEYEVGGIDLYPVIGTTSRLPGNPRTYGVDLSYDF